MKMNCNSMKRKKTVCDPTQKKISSFFKPQSPNKANHRLQFKSNKEAFSSDSDCEIIPPTPVRKNESYFVHPSHFKVHTGHLAKSNAVPNGSGRECVATEKNSERISVGLHLPGVLPLLNGPSLDGEGSAAGSGFAETHRSTNCEQEDVIPPTQKPVRIIGRPTGSPAGQFTREPKLLGRRLLDQGLSKKSSNKRLFPINDECHDDCAASILYTSSIDIIKPTRSPVAKHSRRLCPPLDCIRVVASSEESEDVIPPSMHPAKVVSSSNYLAEVISPSKYSAESIPPGNNEIPVSIADSTVLLDISSEDVDETETGLQNILPEQNPPPKSPRIIKDTSESTGNRVSPSLGHKFSESRVAATAKNALSFFNKTKAMNAVESRKRDLEIRFGLHIVSHVDYSVHSRGRPEKKLLLNSCVDDCERHCDLRGYWADTPVNEGDVVSVLGQFDGNRLILDDMNPLSSGLLVVNPDRLVSSSTIVSSLFCKRKALFNEWFKGLDSGNAHMFVGTVVHQLFQDAIQQRLRTERDVQQHLESLLSRPNNILELYKFQDAYSTGWFFEEFAIFVPKIVQWIRKYLLDEAASGSDLRIVKIVDIEETVWSPRLGVKGRLDLTVEVAVHNVHNRSARYRKIMPLELKTGKAKASPSVEHTGQVTLYSMMNEDRRPHSASTSGLLLYLRDEEMREVAYDTKSRQGVVQRRNELVSYLNAPLTKRVSSASSQRHALGTLPDPIADQRLCEKCPYLTTCAARFRVDRDEPQPGSYHRFQAFADRATAHLGTAELAYFADWCSWIFLESIASEERSPDTKSIWWLPSEEREKCGECLANMALVDAPQTTMLNDPRFPHTFVRTNADGLRRSTPLSQVGLTANQSVIVSVEAANLVALAAGFVDTINDESVSLHLDRNLYEKSALKQAVFRIDALASQSFVTTSLCNVSRLMNDTPEMKRLRDIIVHRREATFQPKITQDCVSKGKDVLRGLNTEQAKAVIQAQMSNDYLLIKGMPGTGKTASIVALIRLLRETDRSVLLVSHTHSAVDNVLLKLKNVGLDFLRLGSTSRIHADLFEYSEEEILNCVTTPDELHQKLSCKKIVATTCLGSNHKLFSRFPRFDYCVMDEASQVLQPIGLGPLFYCDKFILVGDHDQLPPVVQSLEAKSLGFDESIFARLYSPASTVKLTTQYRMNSEITRLANVLVYKQDLKCASETVANSVISLQNSVSSECRLLSRVLSCELNRSVLFVNTDTLESFESSDSNAQVYNELEARILVQIIVAFLQAGLDPNCLGVICPFRKQVEHVTQAVTSSVLASDASRIEISTVDQYQGREKEAILFSCVRSRRPTADTSPNEILNDPRRINVAITRARTKLIIVGSRTAMEAYEPMQKVIEALRSDQMFNLSQEDVKGLDEIGDVLKQSS